MEHAFAFLTPGGFRAAIVADDSYTSFVALSGAVSAFRPECPKPRASLAEDVAEAHKLTLSVIEQARDSRLTWAELGVAAG